MRNYKKGQWAGILVILLGIIFIVGAGYGVSYLISYWMLKPHTVTAQIDSAHKIIEKTYDADNAIYNYEWFKTQYEKIQANRQQIETAKQNIESFKNLWGTDPKQWDSDTRSEYTRLTTILTGLKNQDNNLVADYNARSKMANRNIFENKLPMSVDTLLW